MRPAGIPKINKTFKPSPATEQPTELESVEQRLIRKGEEYKTKKVQKIHELTQDETINGPQYKPNLVANNDKYLPDNT